MSESKPVLNPEVAAYYAKDIEAAWLLDDAGMRARLADPRSRDAVLAAVRAIESEPSLLGASAHIALVARRPS